MAYEGDCPRWGPVRTSRAEGGAGTSRAGTDAPYPLDWGRKHLKPRIGDLTT